MPGKVRHLKQPFAATKFYSSSHGQIFVCPPQLQSRRGAFLATALSRCKVWLASQTAGPQCFPPSADETEVDLTVEPGVHKYSVPHSSQGIEGKHFALPAVLGERWRSSLTRPVVACSSFDVASTAIGIGVGVVGGEDDMNSSTVIRHPRILLRSR